MSIPLHGIGWINIGTYHVSSNETTPYDIETGIYKGVCQGCNLTIEIQAKDYLGNPYGYIKYAGEKPLQFVSFQTGTASEYLIKIKRPSNPALLGEYLEWKAYLVVNGYNKLQLSVINGLSYIERTKYKMPDEGVCCTLELTATDQGRSVESKIRAFVVDFCNLSETCDRSLVYKLYASQVKRYHNSYNTNVDHVAECYANYDTKFGVYGKHSQARWETLNYVKTNNGYNVTYIEDYSIDRYDTSKWSVFVLKKHIELDKYFQIVSVYDDQISKSK